MAGGSPCRRFGHASLFPLHGPVDESKLALFLFSGDPVDFLSGSWSRLEGAAFSRDTVDNTVSFDVSTSVFASDSVYLGIAVVPEPSIALLLGAGMAASARGVSARGAAAALAGPHASARPPAGGSPPPRSGTPWD